jgi:hypothetical protein
MNLSMIQENKDPKKFYARCGLCNKNFSSKRGVDAHFKSEEHQRRLARWYALFFENREKGFSYVLGNMEASAKEVLAEETREEVVKFD